MIVLDTHAWIWWLAAPRRLSKSAKAAIERSDRIGVSVLSVFEVGDLESRGKITLDLPVRDWVRNALAYDRVESLALTAEVAMDAAQLRFEANPADRIIYATARAEDAQLVTRDERIRRFDPVRTIW